MFGKKTAQTTAAHSEPTAHPGHCTYSRAGLAILESLQSAPSSWRSFDYGVLVHLEAKLQLDGLTCLRMGSWEYLKIRKHLIGDHEVDVSSTLSPDGLTSQDKVEIWTLMQSIWTRRDALKAVSNQETICQGLAR